MKKKWIQKGVSIALALAMTLGLTACGGGGKVSADPGLAKQYVYACQNIEMPVNMDNSNINGGYYKDGRIYLVVNENKWDDMGRNEQTMSIVSMKEDGTDVQSSALEMPEQEVLGTAGAENSGENGDNEVGDGAVPMPLPTPRTEVAIPEAGAEEPADEAVADEPAVEAPMMDPNTYEYVNFMQHRFREDGSLVAIKRHSYESYSETNQVSINKDYICSWNPDGSLISQIPLEEVNTQEEWLYISALVPMQDGSMAVLYAGDSMQMSIVDADGNVSPRKALGGDTSTLQNGGNFIVKDDGSLLLTYYDQTDWTKMYISSYDLKTGTFGEKFELPKSFSTMGYNYLGAGLTTDLVYTNQNGVFALNMGDAEPKQMMSYLNSDLNISSMQNIVLIDDTHFVGTYYDSVTYTAQAGLFTKVDAKDIPDKEVLVLAGNYVGSDVKSQIVDFNKTNDKYRIVIKEYQEYATMDDWQAGYKQLNNDIISGNMPDILVVDGNLSLDNYISKGLLADINSLIQKDEELSQVELMQNVIDAYSVDGKLYQTIPYFNVMTMIGKKSIVGDRSNWTMKDLQDVMATMPEGTAAIGDLTRARFLSMMMQYCGSEFVDASTGKCNFDSQNFRDILAFAKELPEELGQDYYGDDYWMTYESQYRENRTILMDCYISAIRYLNQTINGSFGEPVSFIGFPTENGNGSIISVGQGYAISAKSKNAEGAWEFARQSLTLEAQKKLDWGMPIVKSVFTEKAQEALNKPYFLDENGNKVEYDDYYYINGESFELPPMSQEQIDEIVSFIQSVNAREYRNENISKILEEETAAYFAGQKTVDEVVQIIQSRAQIYISENS